MTSESISVPDEGTLTFKLWFPRWTPSNGRTMCRFDATLAGLNPLADGSTECLREFLTDLGIPDAVVCRWSIRPYSSPFFSDYPDAHEWRDRVLPAWQIDVEIEGEHEGDTDRGPYGTYGFDETSLDADEPSEGKRSVVVIGVPSSGTHTMDLPATDDLGSIRVEPTTGVVRADLGELDLPDDLDRIDEVVAAFRELGLRTDWRTASQ